jgi:two-component system OmpR family sensor kinase
MSSIRHKLIAWLIAAVLLTGLIAAAGVYRQARAELDEVFDYHLRQMALSLREGTFADAVEPGDIKQEFDFVVQIWDRAGLRLYFSRPHTALPNSTLLGFANVNTAEGSWRVYGIQQHGITIQVAQPMNIRNRLAAASALRTLIPFLLLVALLGVLVWFVVGRELRSLEAVAHAVGRRTAVSLDPLSEGGLPDEVRPLVGALNDLLMRLGRTLAVQRDFVADAAHELRTPLAALRLQIQLAERAGSEDDRASAFETVRNGLNRATHVVEQLLTLARQEPEAEERITEAVGLATLARQVVAERMPIAEAKAVDLGVTRAESLTVQADAESLRILLANLIDNAVRHVPQGGRVDVAVFADQGCAMLEVIDNGPGIPAAERERVFDRFYRRPGNEVSGSGLGLAIVRNIADRHRARVSLADAPGGHGLAVRVAIPTR